METTASATTMEEEEEHIELLASLPPERIIVSDMDVPMEEIRKEREAYQRRLREQLTPQLVQLHPNVPVPMQVWLTPQEVIELRRLTQDDYPYKAIKCYHDSEPFRGVAAFPVVGYDTLTDRFLLDVAFPFCSRDCTRTSLYMEQQPKSNEKIYWTNELAKRCGEMKTGDVPRGAPQRAWLIKFCLLEEDDSLALDIVAFRKGSSCCISAVDPEVVAPHLEAAASRLCTTMEDPQFLITEQQGETEIKSSTSQPLSPPPPAQFPPPPSSTAETDVVVMAPYTSSSKRTVWLTAAQLLAASRRDPNQGNQFISPITHRPYRYAKKCCYHDGAEFTDELRFAAQSFDTITDRFLVDISVGYCSTACTRESLNVERQPKFMEKIHWTNEMARLVFCEFELPRYALPRNCHADHCIGVNEGKATPEFRQSVQLKHSTELLHPRLEPIPIRLCSMMPPPKLIHAVGDVGETRPYVTILSASNRQPPLSIEKPEHALLMQQQMQQTRFPALVAASTAATAKHSYLRSRGGGGGPNAAGMPGPVLAALNALGLQNVSSKPYSGGSSSSSSSSSQTSDSAAFIPEEVLLPSGQIQVKPALTGLSKSYGVL